MIPALSGVLGVTLATLVQWLLFTREKRRWHVFSRKEELYAKMIDLTKGFYTASYDATQIDTFVRMIRLLWLYAPDNVIEKAYGFTNSVHTQQKCSDDEKNAALGDFICALRKDMNNKKIVKRTKLTPENFQHIRASEKT